MPLFSEAALALTHEQKKMPAMIFSHGVAGTRNTYSHLLSSIASHGIVVFALEHRDGSAPITFISRKTKLGNVISQIPEILETQPEKAPEEGDLAVEWTEIKHKAHAHQFHAESELGRDTQLEIRCRELGELYDTIKYMGEISDHVSESKIGNDFHAEKAVDSTDVILRELCSRIDLDHLIWSGHSFGAATIVQFLKSCRNTADRASQPLFDPHPNHSLAGSRTLHSGTAVILFDIWCVPLVSVRTIPLAAQHLPSRPLVILSEEFRNLKVNVQALRRFLSSSEKASAKTESASLSLDRPAATSEDPTVFSIRSSAHISQSDIGLLFPSLTRLIYKSASPKVILELNVRAAISFLREKKFDIEPFLASSTSASHQLGLLESLCISEDDE